MEKTLTATLIIILLLSMFLMLAFNIRAQNAAIDWWSMFHHDLTHSGYSKSSAPNVNNTA